MTTTQTHQQQNACDRCYKRIFASMRSADNSLRAFCAKYGDGYLWLVEFDRQPVAWLHNQPMHACSDTPSAYMMTPNKKLQSLDKTASIKYNSKDGTLTWYCDRCKTQLCRKSVGGTVVEPRVLVRFVDEHKPGGWVMHVPSHFGCYDNGLLGKVQIHIYSTFNDAYTAARLCELYGWLDEQFDAIPLPPLITLSIDACPRRKICDDIIANRFKYRDSLIDYDYLCYVLKEAQRTTQLILSSCVICGGPASFCHPVGDECWKVRSAQKATERCEKLRCELNADINLHPLADLCKRIFIEPLAPMLVIYPVACYHATSLFAM